MKKRITFITLGLVLIPSALLMSQIDDLFGDPEPSGGRFAAGEDVAEITEPEDAGDIEMAEPLPDVAVSGASANGVFGDDGGDASPGLESASEMAGGDALLDEPSYAGVGGGEVGFMNMSGASGRSKSSAALSSIYQRIMRLKKALSATKEVGKRNAISRQLKKEVDHYFDVDLKRRREEIRKLKRKIEEMEYGLDRRERAKKKIVDLQLQTFIFEAQGFGLFNAPASFQEFGNDDLVFP